MFVSYIADIDLKDEADSSVTTALMRYWSLMIA